MEQSTKIIEIAKALTKFQSKIETVKKDATNPFFKSKYATLENIIESVRGPLEACGLSFSQFPTGENELTTILMHTSGEYLKATTKMAPKEMTPQAQGSAITYMRRYALSAVLGLATEEDDDANLASRGGPKKVAPEADTKKPASPAPAAKVAPKRKPSVKEEIMHKLKVLGVDLKGAKKEEANRKIEEMTKLVPIESNLAEINNRLAVMVAEQEEANQK